MKASLAALPIEHSQVRVGARPAKDQTHSPLCRLHIVSDAPSSQRPQHGGETDVLHRPQSGKISGPSKTEVRDKIATALKAVPNAKVIVRRIATETEDIPSVDTAEGWRGGVNIPGGYNLIMLARHIPEVRAVVRQLIDSDFDQDPRAYAMFIEAMRYAQGRVK